MAWAIAGLIDLIFTSLIAVGTSWFYTSRYLAKRTMDRLGRGDVQLLRDMAMILRSLKDRDEILPLGVPEELRGEILSALKRYNKTKEVNE